MTLRKKLLITIACLSCILCVLVTGTIAWLIAEAEPVVYTFIPANISVALTETNGELGGNKMIPGTTLTKDPTVEVKTDISCYVFVKVTESDNLDTYIAWEPADGWTLLTEGVYYREVTADTSKTETFPIVKENKVTVKNTVTKADMEALYNADGSVKTESLPTLSFAAYACQKEGFADAAAAWAEVTNAPATT